MSGNELTLKICIFCHPENLIKKFIPRLLLKYGSESIHPDFSILGVNISTLRLRVRNNIVKIVLVHTAGQNFFEKLRPYYHGASGAIIFFERNNLDSFEAAKCFFQYFRLITKELIIPVIFVDMVENSAVIIIKKAEKLENDSKEFYYEIKRGDFQRICRILEDLVIQVLSNRENMNF